MIMTPPYRGTRTRVHMDPAAAVILGAGGPVTLLQNHNMHRVRRLRL